MVVNTPDNMMTNTDTDMMDDNDENNISTTSISVPDVANSNGITVPGKNDMFFFFLKTIYKNVFKSSWYFSVHLLMRHSRGGDLSIPSVVNIYLIIFLTLIIFFLTLRFFLCVFVLNGFTRIATILLYTTKL